MVMVGQGQLLLRQAAAAASPNSIAGSRADTQSDPAPNPPPPSPTPPPTPPPTPGPGPSPNPPPEGNEVKGKLDHLVGVCPDVSSRLTAASSMQLLTIQKDQGLRDLKAGRQVNVEGVPQVLVDPHFLLATSIDIKK